ncbi:MAG: efflux RND transporter permease subunit, partial [Planctomycetes bacterium]|nr:efflux RND transporter permease subunit [Planctomycetota bacterium]
MRAQQFQLTINTQGRLSNPKEFADVIVKAGLSVPGQPTPTVTGDRPRQATAIVRLRDVVRENKYFFHIHLDLRKLDREGLHPNDVAHHLLPRLASLAADQDAKSPADTLTWLAAYGGPQAPHVEDIANLRIAAERANKAEAPRTFRLGELVVKEHGIERLQTRDEEGVQLGSQQYDQSCTLNGKPSVALSIYQLPGSNALETANGVYAKMRELKKRFPQGLEYRIVYDTTPFIRESVAEVFNTLRDAVILVAIVVLLFLQDWRAMILPMIDVPVSLIGTFAIMALMGYSLNNISLFGLVLAIGIVVDDAIVVLENIERQMAKGYDTRTATIKAMEEITGPILAITLVLCAVFVPCAFISGITGRFFRQFAITIAASTVISAINALTMTPS